MAVNKVVIKGKDELPKRKISVNKDWMLEWLDKYGTLDDVEWFEKICLDNPKSFKSNINNQTYEIPDWAKVRAAFLAKFFPSSYERKPQSKKQYETFEKRLSSLKARKVQEQEQAMDGTSNEKEAKKVQA